MAVERTLILAKPDAVGRSLAGEILARFERRGLVLRAARFVQALCGRHRAGVVGVDDVGVIELAQHLDLAVEAAHHIRVQEEFLANDLECHDPVHELVPGLEDLPHAPFAEPFQQEIRPQDQLDEVYQRMLALYNSIPPGPDHTERFLEKIHGPGWKERAMAAGPLTL